MNRVVAGVRALGTTPALPQCVRGQLQTSQGTSESLWTVKTPESLLFRSSQ